MKRLVKTALYRLLRVRDLDLQSVRDRLENLAYCSAEMRPRHAELSGIFSIDDRQTPNDWLMDLAASVIHIARNLELHGLDERDVPRLVHLWPGEHYRLLAAVVRHIKPRRVIEVGTFTGLSALAMLTELPVDGELVTFDLIPWRQIPGSYLRERDFTDGRLRQIVANLDDFAPHAHLFAEADLIFIDGPKDGHFEAQLLTNLGAAKLPPRTLLVADDIRLWNMMQIWRDLPQPKLDMTSFGHWSGTGFVEIP